MSDGKLTCRKRQTTTQTKKCDKLYIFAAQHSGGRNFFEKLTEMQHVPLLHLPHDIRRTTSILCLFLPDR